MSNLRPTVGRRFDIIKLVKLTLTYKDSPMFCEETAPITLIKTETNSSSVDDLIAEECDDECNPTTKDTSRPYPAEDNFLQSFDLVEDFQSFFDNSELKCLKYLKCLKCFKRRRCLGKFQIYYSFI